MSNSHSLPDSSGLENDDDDAFTPKEVLDQLQKVWQNEMFSPDLLSQRFELVDCVIDQLNGMEDNLSKAAANTTNALKTRIHKMELDRIRYTLSSYLRKRLEKIENHVFHYLNEDERRKKDMEQSKMSQEERKYATEYSSLVDNHFQNSALKQMPATLQTINLSDVAPSPNLEHYVFLRANQKCDDVTVSDASGEVFLELKEGSKHLFPFKAVSDLVEKGHVSLI